MLLAMAIEAYSEEAKTPYVVWSSSNSTLYFTCRSEVLTEGADYLPEGTTSTYPITNVWSGDDVTGDRSGRPAWYSTLAAGSNYVTSVRYVVIEESFKEVKPLTGKYLFYNFRQLSYINGLKNLNTSEMASMEDMFCNCRSLSSLDLSGFNTKKVTSMREMFYYMNYFNMTSLDVSNFDTSNVTDMNHMFAECPYLSSLDLSCFNTQNVTDMASMFSGDQRVRSITFGDGWNTCNVTKMDYMFNNCQRLSGLDVSGFDTGKVTDMTHMFDLCQQIGALAVSKWDTSNVTNMAFMFNYCYYFSGDVSKWNTSKVKYMSYMFQNCRYNLKNIDLSGWDVSNVSTMEYMFSECINLQSIGDVSGWNPSNVTTMRNMFYKCQKLSSVDVSGWKTPKLANMWSMFEECQALTDLDFSNWDTSNVQYMASLFKNCGALQRLDVSGLNTQGVANMSYMFAGCSSLTTLDLSHLNTVAAENMNCMFLNCSGLTTLHLKGFYTSNVTDMGGMFAGCSNLESVYVNNLWSTANVTNGNNMFGRCTSIVGEDGTTFDAENITKDYAHYNTGGYMRKGTEVNLGPQPYVLFDATSSTVYFLYSEQTLTSDGTFTPTRADTPATISNIWYGDAVFTHYMDAGVAKPCWNYPMGYDVVKAVFEPSFSTQKPTDLSYWFNYFQAMEEIQGMEYLDTSETTNMEYMFAGCNSLKSLDLSHFNTEKVTDMSNMFYNCGGLSTLDVSSFVTGNVESMSGMFEYCIGLTTLDVNHFDTSKVIYLTAMFADTNLESIDVSNFDTRNVESVNTMFAFNPKLKSIDLSTFDMSKCVNTGQMFWGCSSLQTIELSGWNTSLVTDMRNMFYSCRALEAIYVDEAWSTASVEKSGNMFYGSTVIIGEDGTTYDETAVEADKAHYGTGGYLRCHHDSYTITIPSSGIGTFSAAENVTIPEGLTAHYCNNYNPTASTMTVEAVSGGVIPAHTGVLVRGAAGETYTLDATTETADAVTDNALVEVTVPTHVPQTQGDYTNFMLKSGKFIMIAEQEASAKMPANKAYLQVLSEQLPSASGSGITLIWDTDGIHDLAPSMTSPTVTYDLTGRRVSSPSKNGVYIVNGKKMIVK